MTLLSLFDTVEVGGSRPLAPTTTNGDLSAHLAKLVNSGYITEEKAFVDRRPQTRYRLTRAGRNAFLKHVAELQALVAASK